MATIKVDSSVLIAKADKFGQIANKIEDYTTAMTDEIGRLDGKWNGDASDALLSKFNKLREGFPEIIKTIQSYEKFLREAATAYDDVENVNRASAEGN